MQSPRVTKTLLSSTTVALALALLSSGTAPAQAAAAPGAAPVVAAVDLAAVNLAAARPPVAYTADSYFRSTVAGTPVDAGKTASFHRFMATHPDQAGTPHPVLRGVGSNRWGTVYAMGKPGDVLWRLSGNVPKRAEDLKTVGFYAPADLADELTLTSDSPFVVHDTVRGQTIWGAKAKKLAGNVISVGAAGRFMHSSNGLDARNPLSTNKTQNERSRGAIPDAMVIRKDLLDAAIANGTGLGHVLHLFIVESDTAAGFVHPMVGTESDKRGFGAEGQRIAIRSDVDLTKRGLSPEGLAIARTLQTHGMYIGDNAGSSSSLKAEQESPTNPVWGGRLQADELRGITWADMVVLS